jgi:hypothetical protein
MHRILQIAGLGAVSAAFQKINHVAFFESGSLLVLGLPQKMPAL